MFDIGFTELLIIGVVALVVVGPQDLPGMFRAIGRFTARARSLGREFTRAMNDAADGSGMNDIAKDLRGMASPKSYGVQKLNEAVDKFEKWEPGKPSGTKSGPKTTDAPALDPERAEAARKISEAGGLAAAARKEREAEARARAEAIAPVAQPAAAAAPADRARPAPAKNRPVRKSGASARRK